MSHPTTRRLPSERAERLDTSALAGMGLGAITAVLVGAALTGLRGQIDSANVALVLVVVVVGAALVGGRWAGATTAVVAALSFDFFHTQPYNSLTIDSADDVETTILLLVVGLVVGELVTRARARRAEAQRGRDEIARIYRVAELVAGGAPPELVVVAVEREIREVLGLRACTYEPEPGDRHLARMARSGAVPIAGYHYAAGGLELPRGGAELPVLVAGVPRGRLVLDPTPGHGVSFEARIVAVALSDQLAAAFASTSPSP